jgi:hypothetical protein
MRHMIHRYLRTRRGQAVLRATRVLTGLAAAFLGMAVFFASPASTAMSGATRHSQSVILTFCSVVLVAVGLVIMVGPDKVNEIAARYRH